MLLIVFLIGSGIVYVIVDDIERNEIEGREAQLRSVNRRAAFEFSGSLDRFVYLMTGIRAYVNYSQEFPTQEELKAFVNQQLDDLGYTDSLIISYIDTNHIFRYSFTQSAINPVNLVGTSVREIRSEAAMKRLDEVMKDEEFHLFPVTNLFEGWVGIPIDFNIVRAGKSVGYIAAIADFKSILEPIYQLEPADEFVFKFSVNGIEFDRERAYDGTRTFHNRKDPKYAGNYAIDDEDYLYSEVYRHGLTFKIGTAYINEYTKNQYQIQLIYGWFIMLIGFVSYSIYRLSKFKKLNDSLKESIDTIEFQKMKLDIQNEELNNLNATKDKFFSIIGHDLRGPLTSINSIVSLFKSTKLTPEEMEEIIERLESSTLGAARLLENLLQWSLVNTGQIKWNPEQVVVHNLVDEVFLQLSGNASEKEILLTKNVDNNHVLKGDRNMLLTIVRNIVSNAIKFSESGTEVIVNSLKQEGRLILEISDQGKGLTEAEKATLFILGDNPANTKRGGSTGLGLILVKEFVDRHKGTIKVQSEYRKGTSFILSFPQ